MCHAPGRGGHCGICGCGAWTRGSHKMPRWIERMERVHAMRAQMQLVENGTKLLKKP